MRRFKHCAYIYQRDVCCCFVIRRTSCCPFLTRSDKCCWNVRFYFNLDSGEQWFSGRVLDSRPRGRGFEPHRRLWARHIYPSLVLVQPRKTRPCLTERLLMGRKESNQTKSNTKSILIPILIILISNKLPFWYARGLRPRWVNHQNMFQSNSPFTKLWKLAFSTPAPNVSSLSLVPFRPCMQYYFFKV